MPWIALMGSPLGVLVGRSVAPWKSTGRPGDASRRRGRSFLICRIRPGQARGRSRGGIGALVVVLLLGYSYRQCCVGPGNCTLSTMLVDLGRRQFLAGMLNSILPWMRCLFGCSVLSLAFCFGWKHCIGHSQHGHFPAWLRQHGRPTELRKNV